MWDVGPIWTKRVKNKVVQDLAVNLVKSTCRSTLNWEGQGRAESRSTMLKMGWQEDLPFAREVITKLHQGDGFDFVPQHWMSMYLYKICWQPSLCDKGLSQFEPGRLNKNFKEKFENPGHGSLGMMLILNYSPFRNVGRSFSRYKRPADVENVYYKCAERT